MVRHRAWVRVTHWLNAAACGGVSRYHHHRSGQCRVRSIDGWWDSYDLFDALHPQIILAYGMNGAELPVEHEAPLRLRVER